MEKIPETSSILTSGLQVLIFVSLALLLTMSKVSKCSVKHVSLLQMVTKEM